MWWHTISNDQILNSHICLTTSYKSNQIVQMKSYLLNLYLLGTVSQTFDKNGSLANTIGNWNVYLSRGQNNWYSY